MRTIALLIAFLPVGALAQTPQTEPPEVDCFETTDGPLSITCIGHGTLMLTTGRTVIHVDPCGRYADYAKLPKADLILITHEHGDHLDADAIELLSTEETILLLTEKCREKLEKGEVMRNGDVKEKLGIAIAAVPAYNIEHMRSPDQPYHPKGDGNGYVLTIGGKRIYIAGDTENIPEMADLKEIDVAFLPMNLPYTMTPEMAADAAKTVRPKVVYPYHFGQTDPAQLVELLREVEGIEVRIRNLQ